MEITEPRRLYQQLAAELKARIEQGVYLVGDKLPAERFIADEKSVSRTVVREAIIMLEVEGYVEVRKGSGIHVISNHPKHQQAVDETLEFASYGPFELLQARQLIETQVQLAQPRQPAEGFRQFGDGVVGRVEYLQLTELCHFSRQRGQGIFHDMQFAQRAQLPDFAG